MDTVAAASLLKQFVMALAVAAGCGAEAMAPLANDDIAKNSDIAKIDATAMGGDAVTTTDTTATDTTTSPGGSGGGCVVGERRCGRYDVWWVEVCDNGRWFEAETACAPGESCIDASGATISCTCDYEGSFCASGEAVAGCASRVSLYERCPANTLCRAVQGFAAGCFADGEDVTYVTGSVVVSLPEEVVVVEGVRTFAPSRATVLATRGTELLGVAFLDAHGHFSLPVRDASSGGFDVQLAAVSRDAAGKERVRITEDALPTSVWRQRLTTVEALEEATDIGAHVIDGLDASSRLYMLEWLAGALVWTDAVFGVSGQSVTIRADDIPWGAQFRGTTPPHPLGETASQIFIGYHYRFDVTVLIHELGHHVALHHGGRNAGAPGGHEAQVAGDLAWSEAFSNVFAQAWVNLQRGVTSARYTYGGYGTQTAASGLRLVEDLETRTIHTGNPWRTDLSGAMDQPTNEWVVAAILWDLIDDTPDEDGVQLDFAELLTAITWPVTDRGAPGFDLVDHLDALICAETLDMALASVIAEANDFPYEPPAACP